MHHRAPEEGRQRLSTKRPTISCTAIRPEFRQRLPAHLRPQKPTVYSSETNTFESINLGENRRQCFAKDKSPSMSSNSLKPYRTRINRSKFSNRHRNFLVHVVIKSPKQNLTCT